MEVVTKKHVAVLGGGLSGLCALKHLSDHLDRFTFVGFERASEIGGQWLYSDNTDSDENGLPVVSSMYYDLISNLPACLMELPGLPHPRETYFVDRCYVLQYLKKYANKFELQKYIKFQTMVTKVRPMSKTENTQWEVTYCDVRDQSKLNSEMFDAVLVCNGHLHCPRIPDVKGIDNFQGTVLHSRSYRRNTHYKGQNIVIIGAKVSGIEIAVQMSSVANKVYLVNTYGRIKTKLPPNIIECPAVERMTRQSVIFEDGSEVEVDTVVYCSGYLYNMPFLEDVVTVENNHVRPLFKHIVHIEHQTLLFIGIPKKVPYFVHNHEEAKFAVLCLNGTVQLPSKREMYEDEKADQEKRKKFGLKPHHAHEMRDFQWDYLKELATFGGYDPFPPVVEKIHMATSKDSENNFLHFREAKYRIVDPETFVDDRNRINSTTPTD